MLAVSRLFLPPCRPRTHLPFNFRRFPLYNVALRPRFRFFATATNPEPAKANRKNADKLMAALWTSLNTLKPYAQVGYTVQSLLDMHMPHISSQDAAYRRVIKFLIKRQFAGAAVDVHERMIRSGYLAPPDIEADILAVALSVAETNEEIQKALDVLVKQPTFSEERFIHLLAVMRRFEVPGGHILRVIDAYIGRHGAGYMPSIPLVAQMVYCLTCAGRTDEAVATIVGHVGPSSGSPSPEPYIAILRGIRDTNSADKETINLIVALMEEHGIPPIPTLFNVLISRSAHEKSLYHSFEYYHLLKFLSTPRTGKISVHPNAYTYISLFKCLANVYRPNMEIRPSDIISRPANPLSPRQLFKDMLLANQRSEFLIDSKLLNAALRAFIFNVDYVGAFVVIRSFFTFRVKVTPKTYAIVLRHFLNRLRGEIWTSIKTRRSQWADRFLGLASHSSVSQVRLGVHFSERLLDYAAGPNFYLARDMFAGPPTDDEPTSPARKYPTKKYVTPSLRMLRGIEPAPKLDRVPLERLLRRAAVAAWPPDVVRDDSMSRRLSAEVIQCKKEMIPLPPLEPDLSQR